jgi:hypothetical protein
MSIARRWGFPPLIVSMGLHGALVGAGLLSGLQVRAARAPELPASVVTAGSSMVEVEVPGETLRAPRATPAVEAAVATATEPKPVAATGLLGPRLTARARPSAPKSPPNVAAISSASVGAAAQVETKALGASDQNWPSRGVLSLGYAMARAISHAAPADAAWRELPVGHVGTIRIELAVDESHHLGEARRLRAKPDEPTPPAVLEGLVERALLLLRGGQFALSGSRQPGVEQFTIDVAIRAEVTDAAGADAVVQTGFSGATPKRAGKAYFRYGTGRAIEAIVSVAHR